MSTVIAYKLFHVRPDGTLGPLYINRRQVVPTGEWVEAESHPTKGFKVRPFWHCAGEPELGHIKIGARDSGRRAWYRVEIEDFEEFPRPKKQGRMWYLAKWLKVLEEVYPDDYLVNPN